MDLRLALLCVVLLAPAGGCAHFLKSRYAMDDPAYAAKYQDGAERGDILGKLKQANDARHIEGLGGTYLSGGTQYRGQDGATLTGLELGAEAYGNSWSSARMGLSGYVGHGDWYAGIDNGVRLQLPTRLSPFVGVGMFHGLSTTRVDASHDHEDNDDDGKVDEWGEKDTEFDGWLSSVYPEVGVHFWPIGQGRITVFSRYMVTTEGRDSDDWLTGFQMTFFSR